MKRSRSGKLIIGSAPTATAPPSQRQQQAEACEEQPQKKRCPHCERAYTTTGSLNKHIRAVHEGPPPPRFGCRLCAKDFAEARGRDQHIATVHERRRDLPCPHCDSVFGRESVRRLHVRSVHRQERPFACAHCASTFSQEHNRGMRAVHEYRASARAAETPSGTRACW